MRTLKFRAYSKKLGMSEPTDFKTLVSTATDFNEFDVYMQFTGLVDRHGVEIYEGDILNGTCMYKVRLAHGQWEIVVLGADKPWYQIFGNTHLLEVVGNIYENPDLLTPTEGGKTE